MLQSERASTPPWPITAINAVDTERRSSSKQTRGASYEEGSALSNKAKKLIWEVIMDAGGLQDFFHPSASNSTISAYVEGTGTTRTSTSTVWPPPPKEIPFTGVTSP